MSGDVQPRKRKEKRRKRVEGEYHIQRIQILVEDEDSGTPPPQLVNPAEHAMDNVTIHVYKEGSTGGHWCAKIIFFALFSVLIGLVGVIILEHRGTTDVDTPISSSKWAMIFDGWVDDILPSHDNEPHEEENSKEVEHEDEDDHDKESHEEDHDDEDDDEGIGSEEEENEEDEDDDEVNESEAVDIEDDDEEENSEDIEDDEENSEDIEDDEEENSEDIPDDEEEEDEEEDEEDDNEVDVSKVENDEDEGFEDDDNEAYENLDETDELDENESADKEDDDDNDENEEEDDNNEEDEDDITNISALDIDVSVEGVHSPSKEDEEIDFEFMGMPGINEKEDFEKMEIVEGIEVPKEENEDVLDETSVPVKFGVGVALVIAAHIVLVRRWKNAEETIELKRRNTIIPPTIPKKLIVTGDSNKKQQQAKTYQDLKSKYTNLQEDIKRVNKPLSSVENLRDVEKNYSKTKNEPQEIYTSESERFSGTEVESDYLDDDLEAEEDLEDEEELDDEEDIEAEEVDDSELVAKLEAKYGKLPTPSQSEEEEDEEEEEEEEDEEEIEDEEEEEDDEGDWKPGVNAPKVAHSSVEEKKSKEKESTRGRQVNPPPRGGRQAFESVHPGDYDNVNIQDEIEHWLARERID